MKIPFVKAHGALNDFLLTWASDLAPGLDVHRAAIAICHRYAGVGADGWLLVDREARSIRLINSDGSDAEISGNGTRCAAALFVDAGMAGEHVVVHTGAGEKHLDLKHRDGDRYLFEMDMGMPELRGEVEIEGRRGLVIWVGNPQCAFVGPEIPADWREFGARVERHELFPNRTNVSFVGARDRHNIDARFFERGAGATMSSGTGSTGAAFAAITRGLADPPVTIHTEAGPLTLRKDGTLFLTGPAEITVRGEFSML